MKSKCRSQSKSIAEKLATDLDDESSDGGQIPISISDDIPTDPGPFGRLRGVNVHPSLVRNHLHSKNGSEKPGK